MKEGISRELQNLEKRKETTTTTKTTLFFTLPLKLQQ